MQVQNLVLENADYVIDSIYRQLRHLDLNLHVPNVLATILSYIGIAHEILPLLENLEHLRMYRKNADGSVVLDGSMVLVSPGLLAESVIFGLHFMSRPKLKEPKPPEEGECYHCKKIVHWKRNCPLYLEQLKKNKGDVPTTSRSSKTLAKSEVDLRVENGARVDALAIVYCRL
ncbi:TELO2-interacting protein 1-like protein [Cucumis melo var. makuwa]|uniref:TELO2-interacting protein 1-like protein n=1 Tax=Cucumis melo var. makuwa TaxID=1194695 RepID=A0A5D3E7W7_CUCMM|nr:TELO2-interacting protein 1-like protein [Cucumis melo var. makuwa]